MEDNTHIRVGRGWNIIIRSIVDSDSDSKTTKDNAWKWVGTGRRRRRRLTGKGGGSPPMGTILSVPARTCSCTEPPKSPATTSPIHRRFLNLQEESFPIDNENKSQTSCYSYTKTGKNKGLLGTDLLNRRNRQKETSRRKRLDMVLIFRIICVEEEPFL